MSAPTDWRKGLREASPLLSLGWNIALALLFFAGGGIWLDRYLGLTPWLTLLGCFIAFVAMGGLLVRAVRFSAPHPAKAQRKRNYVRFDDDNGAS